MRPAVATTTRGRTTKRFLFRSVINYLPFRSPAHVQLHQRRRTFYSTLKSHTHTHVLIARTHLFDSLKKKKHIKNTYALRHYRLSPATNRTRFPELVKTTSDLPTLPHLLLTPPIISNHLRPRAGDT